MKPKLSELEKCKHPNSRRTIALTKQLKKASNKEKSKQGLAIKQNILGEKYVWFQERVADVSCCTAEQTEALINEYLGRFNDELEQIQLKHSIGNRKNRQHASREDVINLTIKREKEEYEGAGLEIPDIMNPKQLEVLKKWNGELRFLQNLKCRRFSKKFLQLEKEKAAKATGEKGEMDVE